MVANDNGRSKKLARLTDPEFRALIQGVWPIASEATPRGAFMIGNTPATADDVVFMAPKVTKRTASSLLEKMRELRMLEPDDELGGEWVHDWDLMNPAPKSDPTNKDRQARHRARNAESNASGNAVNNAAANGAVTPTEVEGEVEDPPTPLTGGNVVTFKRRKVPNERLRLAERLLEHFNEVAGTGYSPYTGTGALTEDLKRIVGALTDHPTLDEDIGRRMIKWRLAHPFDGQWDGKPHTGVVFGPGVVQGNRASATEQQAEKGVEAWL